MSEDKQERVFRGLQQRIEWCVSHDRPEEEISKLVELIMIAANEFVRDDARDAFFDRLLRNSNKP